MKMINKLSVLVVAGLLTLSENLWAQTPVSPTTPVGSSSQPAYLDAEILAQAFLLHETDHYEARLWSADNGGGKGGAGLDIYMVLDKNLFITSMWVNSTNIPLPKPLPGIPIPASGLQNASVNIIAVDKNGQIAAQGQFSTNYLAQGSRLNITMWPQLPPVAVQIGRGLNQDLISVRLDGVNGWGWSYDPTTGLLTMYVYDPSTTDIVYTVTDGSGTLLAHGNLPFFQASPGAGTGTNSVFSLQNEGGVLMMPLGPNGYNYLSSVAFDSTVTRNNQIVSAKVICVPDIGYQSRLYINTYGVTIGSIEVRKWSATGTMDIVPCTVTIDKFGNTTVISSQYLDKAVITVIPANPTTGKFQVQVCRTY